MTEVFRLVRHWSYLVLALLYVVSSLAGSVRGIHWTYIAGDAITFVFFIVAWFYSVPRPNQWLRPKTFSKFGLRTMYMLGALFTISAELHATANVYLILDSIALVAFALALLFDSGRWTNAQRI